MQKEFHKVKDELIVFSSGYPSNSGDYLAHTFVKGYVDEAKNYFKKIKVFVLLPYIPFFLMKFAKKYPSNLKSYTYDNVSVTYLSYLFIPLPLLQKYRGKIVYSILKYKVKSKISSGAIIHANFTNPSGVFVNLLCKDLKKDFTLTVHEDHDWLMQEYESNNSLFIDAWKNAKNLIRVNKKDNKLLSKFNSNVLTIPNGFNHRVFKKLNKDSCRDILKIDRGDKVIINIGFYNNQKNQKLLIEAISLLPDNIKESLRCFIIGGGSLKNKLENQVVKASLEKNIKIVGQVAHNDLPIYLNSADIFCLSSNSEGNPTVMFEALSIGLPYIGTSVGGIPEIINSENYGFLCKPNSAECLKNNIERGLLKKWNTNLIVDYAKQFSWKNIFLTTKQYY